LQVLKTFGFVLGKGRGSFVDRVSEILEGKRLLLRLVRAAPQSMGGNPRAAAELR
jgi:hypothetical protein